MFFSLMTLTGAGQKQTQESPFAPRTGCAARGGKRDTADGIWVPAHQEWPALGTQTWCKVCEASQEQELAKEAQESGQTQAPGPFIPSCW